MSHASLKVVDLCVTYGRIQAVDTLSFSLGAGETLAILGANGAGKTSALEAISGLLPKAKGKVQLHGQEVGRWDAAKLTVSAGLTLVPQWRELFPAFTVEETLLAGLNAGRHRGRTRLDDIYDLFPKLDERRQQIASTLSGGEQQMLAIGRALATEPRILLLDEPTAGLSVGVVASLQASLQRIQEKRIPILLVEQNVQLAANLATRCIVMASGRLAWQGPTRQAIESPEVRRAYFGTQAI